MAYVPDYKRGPLNEHVNAENTAVPPALTFANQTIWYWLAGNGDTVISQAITTTRKCCIVIVASVVQQNGVATDYQIRRDGVDRTVEVTVSAIKFGWAPAYGYLLYATEVLDSGTYTYSVVCVSGVNRAVLGALIKIVAVAKG